MSLEDDPFDYQVIKSGVLLIRRGGRTVMQLGGRKAGALIPKLGREDDTESGWTFDQLLVLYVI